jgi:hypothetical protein
MNNPPRVSEIHFMFTITLHTQNCSLFEGPFFSLQSLLCAEGDKL